MIVINNNNNMSVSDSGGSDNDISAYGDDNDTSRGVD